MAYKNAAAAIIELLKGEGITAQVGPRTTLTGVTLEITQPIAPKTLRKIDAITKNYTTDYNKNGILLIVNV